MIIEHSSKTNKTFVSSSQAYSDYFFDLLRHLYVVFQLIGMLQFLLQNIAHAEQLVILEKLLQKSYVAASDFLDLALEEALLLVPAGLLFLISDCCSVCRCGGFRCFSRRNLPLFYVLQI